MAQNLADNVGLGDGSDDAQRPPSTRGATLHVEGEDALEQSCPVPLEMWR
jgi:hypothetical protein